MKIAILFGLTAALLQGQTPAPALRKPASIASRVEPEYTEAARAAGLQGTATLYVEVSQSGEPRKIEVMQGLGMGLDEKAVDAVKRFTFTPAMENGQPIRSAHTVEIRFARPGAVWRLMRAAYWVPRPDPSQAFQVAVEPALRTYAQPSSAPCQSGAAAALEFTIGADGIPKEIRASDPLRQGVAVNAGIASAVVGAVSAWNFQPATLDGQRVPSQASIELECGGPQRGIPELPARPLGDGVSKPQLTFKTEPGYAEAARKIKLTGSVAIDLEVDETGHPGGLSITRLLGSGLDQKAVEAVLRWRFKPGVKGGRPVRVLATVQVTFNLL